jgi:hypothetical protein
MVLSTRRIVRRALPALVTIPALTVAGCTSTIDPSSAEHAITANMHKLGPLQVKSVSCPGGVKQAQGVSFNCALTLHDTSNGTTGTGTITLHETNGGHDLEFGPNDVHVR